VVMTYADKTERCNWYRLKAKWMDERNISRLSWDYRDKIGVFTNDSLIPTEARFPEDLNTDLLKAMGFNVPSLEPRSRPSWFENAKKSGDYTIYKNGSAKGIYIRADTTGFRINTKISENDETCIYVPKANPYNFVTWSFGKACDLSNLVNSGKSLEFEIRSNQKNLDCKVYFQDSEIKDSGKNGLPWRFASQLNDSIVPPDGEWHKLSIPLKDFYDLGAWSDIEQKWFNAEGFFSWARVNEFRFEFGEKGLQNDVSIRNIAIR
ncbi:MAG: hypothetical protein J5631_07425, partial [Spirochaetaceae bacterium]|nr:hypothetical protein [Spirochaetaceae bacterium]